MDKSVNIITEDELTSLMKQRDYGMWRVQVTTEYRKKQLNAKTLDEYYSIPTPRIYGVSPSVFKRRTENYDMHNLVDCHVDMYCRGYAIIQEGRIVCRYGNLDSVMFSHLYRGEKTIYPNVCTSTLGRDCARLAHKTKEMAFLEFILGQMRIALFFNFISRFKEYTDYPLSTQLPHVIAQHYGLSTQYLDLTDDIKVALFFACCKFDRKNHTYMPIDSSDLNNLGSYAVLYCGIEDNRSTSVIGYQPFTRCFKQRGYYIDTAHNGPCWEYSIQKNNGFTKSIFDRKPQLCRQIYDEFSGGEILFPKDSLFEFDNVIEKIKHTKSFPTELFEGVITLVEYYLEKYSLSDVRCGLPTKDWLFHKFKDLGVEIIDKIPDYLSNLDVERFNTNWDVRKYKKENDIIAWGRESKVMPEGGFAWSIPSQHSGIDMCKF